MFPFSQGQIFPASRQVRSMLTKRAPPNGSRMLAQLSRLTSVSLRLTSTLTVVVLNGKVGCRLGLFFLLDSMVYPPGRFHRYRRQTAQRQVRNSRKRGSGIDQSPPLGVRTSKSMFSVNPTSPHSRSSRSPPEVISSSYP